MRKIPRELENPIDNIVIDTCDYMCKGFKKLNFTPNYITTISLIFGLIACYTLSKGYIWIAVVSMFISYWMDCIDGYYARKYNMATKLGDLYDHGKDTMIFILYICILYSRNKRKLSRRGWIIAGSVLGMFMLSFGVYFACQERYYDKLHDIPSLSWLTKFIKCKKTAKRCLNIFKYMGLGTFIVVLLVFTLWIEKKS